ncbi:unnamed protein product [Schistocephalus solidus]|uniref:DUF72 domain-containing protein n=1 Tax=Schistocephalus solidus TaxID=70667 RepID=A0A183TPL9_SCHSO|nr:unnamed protein product [Schistocephalus solidus]
MARAQDTALARFYGLPKEHKAVVPIWPSVSRKGYPNNNFDSFYGYRTTSTFQQDFSPAERNKRHQLVIELRRRLSEGETNLVIYNNQVIHRPFFFHGEARSGLPRRWPSKQGLAPDC